MFTARRNYRASNIFGRLLMLAFCLMVFLLAGCGGGPQQSDSGPMIRAGHPDFEQYQKLIKIDELEADEAARPIGDIVMTLRGTVRNFTGRTLNGLEVRAMVVDTLDKPVKERTVMVIPGRQPELDHNQTMKTSVLLEGIDKNAIRANIKMEVTGFRFK